MCGPDVGLWLSVYLDSISSDLASALGNKPTPLKELAFKKFFEEDRQDPKAYHRNSVSLIFESDGCPKNCNKGDEFPSVTLCGKCFDSSVPGNIAFGYVSASIGDMLAYAGAKWTAEKKSGGWPLHDQDAVKVGRILAREHPSLYMPHGYPESYRWNHHLDNTLVYRLARHQTLCQVVRGQVPHPLLQVRLQEVACDPCREKPAEMMVGSSFDRKALEYEGRYFLEMNWRSDANFGQPIGGPEDPNIGGEYKINLLYRKRSW